MDNPFSINNEGDFSEDLLNGMNKLRENGTFCDVTLRVGKRTIRAHRNVICACSLYLKNILSSNDPEIVLNDIDGHHLELLVEYMYTGTLNFDASNVKEILLTASFLQISSAVDLCCNFLANNLVSDNCIEYILFAGKNSMKSLMKQSLDMAVLNFHHIFSKNDYLEIGAEELKRMIQLVKESEYPEDLIFSFVMRWINHSYEARISCIEKLIDPTEYLLISPEVMDASKIANNSNSDFAAWAARHNAALNNGNRHPTVPTNHVLVSRRLSTFRPLRIKIFSENKHHEIQSLPDNITDGSYVCHGYYIYHQGGWKSNKELLTETYSYHPLNYCWAPFVPLQQARAYHRSCVLNGRIYTVGGSDGLKALPSVEFADLYTGQRGFTDPLPRAKERAGLGLHENSIYVVGGSDRATSYKSIHRFDTREGVWQELAPSPYRAGATSCAVVEENIYTTHSDAMQRYDIRANEWSLIFAQYKRYPQEVFTYENTLFGLFSGHIAKFLPDRGKWVNLRALKFSLPHLQASTNLCFPSVQIGDPFDFFINQALLQVEEDIDFDERFGL